MEIARIQRDLLVGWLPMYEATMREWYNIDICFPANTSRLFQAQAWVAH
jgi:hypothetical protein